jgi:hypothetical protein
LYQCAINDASPACIFSHVFGEDDGWIVTFTGRQARLERNARPNELTKIQQRSFLYPKQVEQASNYLVAQGKSGRDTYFGVHLFRQAGTRRAANSVGTMSCLWLDEDGGHFPANGPEPTGVVRSSEERRHLYWKLTRPVSAEWVVAMNRRIAQWAGGDIGKAALATVLRVPRTFNYKRHPKVDPVICMITGTSAWEPEVLEQAIPPLPESPGANTTWEQKTYNGPEVELLAYLNSAEVEILADVPDDGGKKFAIVCPRVGQHTGRDRSGTYVGQFADGALWFHCHHESCQGYGSWSKFRRLARPRGCVKVELLHETGSQGVVIRLGR